MDWHLRPHKSCSQSYSLLGQLQRLGAIICNATYNHHRSSPDITLEIKISLGFCRRLCDENPLGEFDNLPSSFHLDVTCTHVHVVVSGLKDNDLFLENVKKKYNKELSDVFWGMLGPNDIKILWQRLNKLRNWMFWVGLWAGVGLPFVSCMAQNMVALHWHRPTYIYFNVPTDNFVRPNCVHRKQLRLKQFQPFSLLSSNTWTVLPRILQHQSAGTQPPVQLHYHCHNSTITRVVL